MSHIIAKQESARVDRPKIMTGIHVLSKASLVFWLLLGVLAPSVNAALSSIRRRRSSRERSFRRFPTETPALSSSTSLSSARFPLISPTDTWGNLAVLTGTATLAQTVGTTTTLGRLLGPPVTAMALTFTFASVGLLQPGGTSAAKSLQLLSLQLATPLLLLGADLRNCVSQCGPLLKSFVIASISTAIACSVGWLVCGKFLSAALGQRDGIIIAAALMAKNIGGGLNYVAVCRSLQSSPEAFAAGLCVDNIFGLLYFPVSSALAAGRPDLEAVSSTEEASASMGSNRPISIQHVSSVATIATVMTWLGELIGGPSGALPVCTLLTVLVASLGPLKWIQPLQPAAHVMGNFCLYLFFATAGAPGLAVADSVKQSIVPLGMFNILLYCIHGAIMWWTANAVPNQAYAAPQRMLVASSAAIGGPATAAALAQANGWKSLVAPSLLVGNLGYAIATFLALGFHRVFSKTGC